MTRTTNEQARKHLAKTVKSIRKSKNLTQTQLGKKVGLTQKAISKIECGKTDQPRAIRKIAEIGNMPIAQLVDPRYTKR